MSKQSRGARRACSQRGIALALVVAVASLLALAGTASAKSSTVWLCKPGKKPNPCMQDRSATVVTYSGVAERHEALQKPVKAGKAPIDCFYVYPTVSEQEGPNANLEIEPQETQIAIDQASRFSQDCKVYAPMYPQLTLNAIKGVVTPENALTAYSGVLAAFLEYMHKFNKGHGIVLIGHSQGALMLENLIKQEFDGNPALRKQLVSAILLGGNVLVPEGQLEGVSFQHVPLCTAATETGCVIAYSTFLQEPPENAFFGRPGSALLEGGTVPPGSEVACVNPTLLKQQTGTPGNLLLYAPTTPFPGALGGGSPVPSAPTPWVETLGAYRAKCMHENGATWLQPEQSPSLSTAAFEDLEAHNETARELIGPEWGLHLYDVNIALGNLVHTVAVQTQAFGFEA
jgi:Protein of unknown function (DUF3089)